MVRARGREWVVLPTDDPETLRLRPLGGTDEDACGLYLPLEGDDVASASLPLPDPRHAGNALSATLLRDAVRLGFRSAAGPLRSIARIAVEPRPYQLVPLLMALRQDTVRLLIGDDVGVGKTIEAAMIARELLDRGEIRRICVLCPPHLCEQWRKELIEKFHLPAVEVRPGTITALERDLPLDRSVFQEYPVTVVSIDFIKSDRRRARFVQTCPKFVIVDEAHAAAHDSSGGAGQQQRHSLLRELAADKRRHIVLVTATPHSGNEGAFASLTGLLVPEFEQKVAHLEYAAGTDIREQLARHFVQRRRADIDSYLDARTVFPTRETMEQPYHISPDYKRLLDATRNYTQELIRGGAGLSVFHQRVRWWAALALLRCISSSPAAASLALRTRADRSDELDVREADRLGQDAVFDLVARDEAEQDDSTPGADLADEDTSSPERRRLLALARQADALMGTADPKMKIAEDLVRDLLKDGFQPIVFCRYVATAHYVGEELARRLNNVRVQVVTGELPAEERSERVLELARVPKRVLVATDCLSEGINLQQHFNAVVHYDLSWNPTRHEQREGRVDRYGQPSPVVRTALIYGQDNQVDGVVLRVLLRKAEKIRRTLGVNVPVPVDTNAVLEAIFEALFLRPNVAPEQLSLFLDQEEERVNQAWEAAEHRERRARTVFAQHGLKPEEVMAELKESSEAVGTSKDVQRFVIEACTRLGAAPTKGGQLWQVDIARLPRAVTTRLVTNEDNHHWNIGFELPVADEVTYISRTHPLVEALSSHLLDTALAEPKDAVAKRCAAVLTNDVSVRTVLLLLRARFLIEEQRGEDRFPMLAEECLLAGFRDDDGGPAWLGRDEVEKLVRAEPSENIIAGRAQHWLQNVINMRPTVDTHLQNVARERADKLLLSHRRVRTAAQLRGVRYRVEPHQDIDLLGLYVLMPDQSILSSTLLKQVSGSGRSG
ncbi:MAG: DEAD/DEAH box helicase [Chloroflexi bacterium]|nr:DEAD/DEAH box helicase [Chloroflexota bacterium]